MIFGIVCLLRLEAACRADRRLNGSRSGRRAMATVGASARHAGGQAAGRRSSNGGKHASFMLSAIEQHPDPTLVELREMLAVRGVSVSIATLSRFFARHGITRKKEWPRE